MLPEGAGVVVSPGDGVVFVVLHSIHGCVRPCSGEGIPRRKLW